MKLLLVITLLCTHSLSLPPQEKQKADTVKKVTKPAKVNKATAPLYPNFLIVNTY